MIGVRVLGPLEVTVDGARAGVGGPRQRCVLARLVAARGQVVSIDRLIEDLYAGEAPPRALAAVQSYVSHLRRVLEPDRAAWVRAGVLAASPPGYALRLGRDLVDAWAFEDAVVQAAAADDPGAVDAVLSAPLASWRGTAFQEFADLPWADLEASRLEELRLTAVEMRAAAWLRLGRAAQLVPDLDKLTTEHPLREEAWRLLALALYLSGRQGDALAALRRARSRLAEELGIDPGPALRELEGDILAQAPRLAVAQLAPALPVSALGHAPAAAVSAVGASALPRADDSPVYVGREAELAQILGVADEAAVAGRVRVLLVTGDAGAGKTALADWVSRHLAGAGWTVAAGRCPEHEGAPPGWPWAEALRRLARAVPPAEPGPLAALLTDAEDAKVPDAAAGRFRLHRAVTGYLEMVSLAAPLVVVLDDLHWADSETLAIFAAAAADLTGSRIVLLGTYRPAEAGEQLSACLAALATREPARITLRGLDTAAGGELIRAACTSVVDDATIRTITERAGGNPFFIREIARLLDSEGVLAAATEVPAGVREVLQRRIGRLPAAAQTVLRAAAVLGTETSVAVLADVAGVGEHVLLDAVEAGLIAGLVTEPAPGRVRFAHALVRDTLYQGLSRLRRARLHARAGEAIERHSPGEVAALAHHYAEAGSDPAMAARYCGLAAEQAERRFAYPEAAALWERAITCLDRAGGVSARSRLEVVLSLVRALAYAGELARARSWCRDAIAAARPLDDPALLARAITAFHAPWPAKEYGSTDDELITTVEQTLTRLPPGEQLLRCRLLTTLAFELDGGESERGYQASAEAVQLARRLDDPDVVTMALRGRYVQSFRHDGLDERLQLGAELLALPGKPVTAEAFAHVLLMHASSGTADFSTADLHAAEAARIASEYTMPVIAALVGSYRAMRAALAGDPSAERRYQQVGEQMDRLGMWQDGAVLSASGRFCLLLMQDRVAEMADELESFYSYPPFAATAAESYALTLAAAGGIARARAVAGEPRPIRRDHMLVCRTAIRGLLGIAIDDRDRAESAYQALLPFAARPVGADTGFVSLWPGAQVLGDLAGYLGLPGADAHYRHALAVASRARVPVWREAAERGLREASH